MGEAAPEITPRELADDLVADIERRRLQRFDAEESIYAPNNVIASDADPDSCRRRQVLKIVAPEEQKPFDAHIKARLETGRLLEREALRELLGLGFDVSHQQVRFELRSRRTNERCLSGKIDGQLQRFIDIALEIKSMPLHAYSVTDTIEDLLNNFWYRNWVFQMQSYLIGHGMEVGFFWVTDCLGHWKPIVCEIDYEMAEGVWTMAEAVMDAVKEYRRTKTLPPPTERHEECVNKCPFFGRACQPEIPSEGAVMYRNGMLEEALRERAEIEEQGKRFASLDRKIKNWLKGFQQDEQLREKKVVFVGRDFLIEFEDQPKREYTVPARVDRVAKITRINHETTKVVSIEGPLFSQEES